MLTKRLFHLKGYIFRDLRTGASFELLYDNCVDMRDYTEYYVLFDNNFVINAIPV